MSRTDRRIPSLPAVLLLTALFLLSGPVLINLQAADPAQSGGTAEQIMAGLSDEEVRQLLIEELRKEALSDTPDAQQMKGPAAFLSRLLNLLSTEHDDNKNEVRSLFAALPAVGPELHRVFVKL